MSEAKVTLDTVKSTIRGRLYWTKSDIVERLKAIDIGYVEDASMPYGYLIVPSSNVDNVTSSLLTKYSLTINTSDEHPDAVKSHAVIVIVDEADVWCNAHDSPRLKTIKVDAQWSCAVCS